MTIERKSFARMKRFLSATFPVTTEASTLPPMVSLESFAAASFSFIFQLLMCLEKSSIVSSSLLTTHLDSDESEVEEFDKD